MTATYITGTRTPGAVLLTFIPDFVDTLIHQGHSLVTTNKRGVDEAVVKHCQRHQLPLHVCEFLTGKPGHNRCLEATAPSVRVQKIQTPIWMRFRHLAERSEKMLFLHSAKSRGERRSVTTGEAIEATCQKYGMRSEQLTIQHQAARWVNVTELRDCPTISAGHVYVYARRVESLDRTSYHLGYYRLDSWRQIGGVIQPGNGRRELVIPDSTLTQATLQMFQQALLELRMCRPYKLVIHYDLARLSQLPGKRDYPQLRTQVSELLTEYPQVVWQREKRSTLLQHIGSAIPKQQELWYHDKTRAAAKGLYQ